MLFVCELCSSVDSTNAPEYDGTLTCTECRTGEWHHLFDKEQYDPTIHFDMVNRVNVTDDDNSSPSFG